METIDTADAWSSWRVVVLVAAIACLVLMLVTESPAATFSARLTHRGLVTDDGGGTTGMLVRADSLPHPGDPTFVYRTGADTVAGAWSLPGNTIVVRSGTSESSPLIGRVVPSWDDDSLHVTIEPSGHDAISSGVFARPGTRSSATLTREISTTADLEGTYRTVLRGDDGVAAGWLAVQIDPEAATQFRGELPAGIPPALAAATAQAINDEIGSIYDGAVDVGPLHR
jgi:hypothetical protein